MLHPGELRREDEQVVPLGPDFADRLERSLLHADRERRRRHLLQRLGSFLPLLLLVGPVVAWRLLVISSGSAHVAIDALAWLTFLLDIAVRVDTDVLSYLGLQALPTVAGLLLFIIVTASLLVPNRGEK